MSLAYLTFTDFAVVPLKYVPVAVKSSLIFVPATCRYFVDKASATLFIALS